MLQPILFERHGVAGVSLIHLMPRFGGYGGYILSPQFYHHYVTFQHVHLLRDSICIVENQVSLYERGFILHPVTALTC